MNNSNASAILVVDPDPSVRTLVVALLRRAGYAAEAAATSDEALHLHQAARHAVVVLEPRIAGGNVLLDTLQSSGRNVIMVTTQDGFGNVSVPTAVRTILFKPFLLDDLAEAVARCCDGGG